MKELKIELFLLFCTKNMLIKMLIKVTKKALLFDQQSSFIINTTLLL